MAGYSTSFSGDGGYIIDQETVTFACNSIEQFTKALAKVSIAFDGNHNAEYDSSADIWGDPLVKSRLIERLDIRSSSDYGFKNEQGERLSRYAHVSLSAGTFSVVNVTVSGDRQASAALRDELAMLLNARCQSYAFLYRKLPTWLESVIVVVSGAIVSLIALIGLMVFNRELAKEAPWLSTLAPIVGLALFLWLRRRMFPKMLFGFGKSAEKVGRAERWRSLILFGLFGSLGISLVGSFLYDKLK